MGVQTVFRILRYGFRGFMAFGRVCVCVCAVFLLLWLGPSVLRGQREVYESKVEGVGGGIKVGV